MVEGRMKMLPSNRKVAFVQVEHFETDIILTSMRAQNRALDGDKVIVEIAPLEKWDVIKTSDKKDKKVGNS
jgi:hypothetical protein